MSIMQRTESNDVRNQVLETVADDRRRRILDILLDRTSPLALDDLAVRIASAKSRDASGGRDASGSGDGAGADVPAIKTSLVHHHLPALEAVDLVEWDRAAGTVAATDHPALADPAVRRILDGDGDELDAVVESLANERRGTVLSVLEERDGPTSRWSLAREIAGREASGEPSHAEIEETLLALHHRHLPKLDDAGLVEYDRDEETVTYRGHSGLDP